MSKSRAEVEKALRKKGFHPRQGDHTYLIFFTADGRKTRVFTKISHGGGGKTLSDALIARMASQVRLRKQAFLALVDCPMSRDDYESHLRELGEA